MQPFLKVALMGKQDANDRRRDVWIAGLGALAVVASRQLHRTCVALTALACEALQADVRTLLF